MKMRWTHQLAVAGIFLGATLGLAEGAPVNLAPTPQQIEWSDEAPLSLKDRSVAIVVGDRASEPERYAAERLQAQVAKRFKQQWPIVVESDAAGKADVAFLLGQRRTNKELDQLCEAQNIKLSSGSPGWDGYVIEMVKVGPRDVVLVGGCNDRGVIYGQDTLFQMITSTKDAGLGVARASIRDFAIVPWRGRAQTAVRHYFRPHEMDIYAAARMNWVDLRGGTYAFEPGQALDHELITKALAEAHRRGMLVYGTVNCGVGRDEYPAVLKTFQELIDLGADGLWISFDDKGPGQAPEEIVFATLELARKNGIPSSRIYVCPPKGSYQEIDTEFNRKIMNIPGMENAVWAWTLVFSKDAMEEAFSIGAKRKTGWWHNWPRLESYLMYLPVPPISMGWHAPDYKRLADVGQYGEMIMPWGGNAWGQYYVSPILSWWGWNPKGHDWKQTRTRIYRDVFGKDAVEDMFVFDDTFNEVKSYFAFCNRSGEWYPRTPDRLKDLKDRPKVISLLKKMEQCLSRVEKLAPRQTMIDLDQLKEFYLDRMRSEVAVDLVLAQLTYPEYWWDGHQRQVLDAVYANDLKKADALIAEAQKKVVAQVDEAVAKLTAVPGVAKIDENKVPEDNAKTLNHVRAGLEQNGDPASRQLAANVTDFMFRLCHGHGLVKPELIEELGRLQKMAETIPGGASAAKTLAAVRDKLIKSREIVNPVVPYAEWWKKWAGMKARDWRQVVAKRREQLKAGVWNYGYYMVPIDQLLKGVDNPPLDWGTGRWERTNKVLDVKLPEEREQFWAQWMAGLYECDGHTFAAFASDRRTVWGPGGYAEMPVKLSIQDGRHDRLALMIFLGNANKDSIGLHHVPNRWSRYRFIQLLWRDQVLWEADLGPERKPGQWFVEELPEIPADVDVLDCRLRTIDRKTAAADNSIAIVGPIHLIELAD